ncbi:MAG: hypothetical protein SVU69_07025 [Pseudomonadota bacterium]|nr:hypothetical protein [Pseudomonadota bacterium]
MRSLIIAVLVGIVAFCLSYYFIGLDSHARYGRMTDKAQSLIGILTFFGAASAFVIAFVFEKREQIAARSEPTPTELSYDQIPWYRKTWAGIASLLLFPPIVIIAGLTGDLYQKRGEEVFAVSKLVRLSIVATGCLSMVANTLRIMATP